jgi:hypothetical protein
MSQLEVCWVFLISLDDQRHRKKKCCKYFGRANITLTAVSSAFLMTCQKMDFRIFINKSIIDGYCYLSRGLEMDNIASNATHEKINRGSAS